MISQVWIPCYQSMQRCPGIHRGRQMCAVAVPVLVETDYRLRHVVMTGFNYIQVVYVLN